jgi:hypothetical protein
MKTKILFVVALTSVLFTPGIRQLGGAENGMLSREQALSALRSHNIQAAEFELSVIATPTSNRRDVAQKSLAAARSKDMALYNNGFFVDLMTAGGYFVLEFDKDSRSVSQLHLITSDRTGKPVIYSAKIHGSIGKDEARSIIRRSEEFSRSFFESPETPMTKLLVKYGGPDVDTTGIASGQGYFAIPEAVKKIATSPGQELQLIGLSNGLALWSIRHAPAMPTYAANPIAAVREANDELASLATQYHTGNELGTGLNFVDHLVDLNSIRTRAELINRLKLLTEFSSYLDARSPLPLGSKSYMANLSISVIPLDLLVQPSNGGVYGATTLPGLITVWKRTSSGSLVLKGLSVAE